MEIVFEDKSIIVCIKPVGIQSQRESTGRESMITLLSAHCGCEVYPLHRLDRDVGGIMVYAKTKAAAAFLSREIAEHRFKKEYIALVHGAPNPEKGEMRDLLFKDSRKNKSFVVDRMRKGVKEALLEYETLCIRDGMAAVKVLLHTGRTHQIRVQFASRKMPLAGDRKYGGRDDFNQIGLFSYKITFTHPITKETLIFKGKPENIIKDYVLEETL